MSEKKKSNGHNAGVPAEFQDKIPADLLRELESDSSTLDDELTEWFAISEYYDELERTAKVPSDRMFHKITDKISEQSKVSAFSQVTDRISQFFRSMWLPWTLAFAQALVILLLVVSPHGVKYTTLSSSLQHEQAASYLNVVFDERASEADIRNLLVGLGAEIVGGPEPNGLYIIKIPISKSELEKVKNKLDQTKIVKFWAPRY